MPCGAVILYFFTLLYFTLRGGLYISTHLRFHDMNLDTAEMVDGRAVVEGRRGRGVHGSSAQAIGHHHGRLVGVSLAERYDGCAHTRTRPHTVIHR